jgi:lysozyme
MLSQLLSKLFPTQSQHKLVTKSSESSPSSASLQAQLHESSNSFLTQATAQIKSDEGLVLHAYKDSLGLLTIGYGRLIDKSKGGGISEQEAEYLLSHDIAYKLGQLYAQLPWITQLSDARKAVLLNMSFQLGVQGLMGFKNTLAKVEAGDYAGAADNMLQSKWATQTPNRAKRMAEQMRTGTWQSG